MIMERMSIEEYRKMMNAGKSTYPNRITTVDGIKFASQLEANYYCELKLLLRSGEIKGFCRQCRFPLLEGEEQTEYVADFVVFYKDGSSKIIDTKGKETDVVKLKMKQFKARYPGLSVEIVK